MPRLISPALLVALAAAAVTALPAGCAQVPEPGSAPSAAADPPQAATSAGGATAATRSGRLTIVQWPNVEIDRKPMRAAPGARILNSNNLTVTPNLVPPGSLVSYELDGTGQIRTLRILATDKPATEQRVDSPRRPTGPRY
jgi:hypothetical protein